MRVQYSCLLARLVTLLPTYKLALLLLCTFILHSSVLAIRGSTYISTCAIADSLLSCGRRQYEPPLLFGTRIIHITVCLLRVGLCHYVCDSYLLVLVSSPFSIHTPYDLHPTQKMRNADSFKKREMLQGCEMY